ncbi:MAG: class I SAM-dependent methyltransferase [Nitrospirae bacterium]|nr:class I SAM-dependent methyltransferase [Nitrospirota bacterium]
MKKTDWDRYYSSPYRTAVFTRKITERILLGLIKKYSPVSCEKLRLGELGGANSCFFEGVREKIKPAQYHVIDNNQLGLDEFSKKLQNNVNDVFLYKDDILAMSRELELDMVFSVGLIEHFTPADTRKAIKAHFNILKPGGIAIISFPTPTFLYRIIRFLSEGMGLWIFNDERPLSGEEVSDAVKDLGTILYEKIIWPIFLTQKIMVIQNYSAPTAHKAKKQASAL